MQATSQRRLKQYQLAEGYGQGGGGSEDSTRSVVLNNIEENFLGQGLSHLLLEIEFWRL
jgi:hypothetical protein